VGAIVDTTAVPPEERFDLWADTACRVFEPMRVSIRDGRPFEGRIWRHQLGPLPIFRVAADTSCNHRTPATIRASDPEWVQVALAVRGRLAVSQGGRASVLLAGDFASWASSEPYVVNARTPFELLVVYCPQALMRSHADRLRRRTAVAVPGDAGVGRLARGFLSGVVDGLEDGTLSADGLPEVAEGMLDLIRAMYGAPVGREEPSGRAPDVLRAQVHAFIDAHLADPSLGPETIAREHFISRSYLDKLFEREGAGVGETIRARRLERCRRDLRDPGLADSSILDIATRWGFVSASHFSRSFRAAYGVTPRDARQA
jgi:AraC-like DNA-binding protein